MADDEKRTESIGLRISESEKLRAEEINCRRYGGALDHPTTLIYKIFLAGLACLEKNCAHHGEVRAQTQATKKRKR